MNGIPMPMVYPLNAPDPQALAFVAAMLTRLGATARPAEPPATGWMQVYTVSRCQACGTAFPAGSRCRGCGGPG